RLPRRLLFPALAVAGALLVGWLLNSRNGVLRRPAPSAPPAEVPEAAPRPAGAAGPGRRPDGGGERVAAPTAALPLLRILALEDQDGSAVPGAEVFLLAAAAVAEFGPDRPLEDLAEAEGAAARTDREGVARFPAPEDPSLALARSGDLFAVAALPQPPPAEFRLRLRPAPTLLVRVEEADGAPAAGVPLGLRPDGADLWAAAAVTGADGLARFPHAAALLPEGVGSKVVVGPRLLLAERIEAEADLQAPPAEPLVLRLPATGRVRVQVRDEGAPFPAGLQRIELAEVDPQPGRPAPILQAAPDADGGARFERVGLGRLLVAEAVFAGGARVPSAPFPGPVAAGEQVEVLLPADRSVVLLAGRVLRPGAGGPLAETTVRIRLEAPSLSGSLPIAEGPARTDAGGRFLWRAEAGGPADRLVVLLPDESGGAELRAEAALPTPLPSGRLDLGDLRLAAPPLLVAGRLLEEGGDPIAGGVVLVEERFDLPGGGGAWRPNLDWRATSGEDGGFVIHAAEAAGRLPLRLVFQGPAHLEATAPFQPGQTGVLLQARRAAAMAGRLLLDPGIPPDALAVTARPDRGGRPRTAAMADDGSFSWRGLEPGGWTVRVEVPGFADDLLAEIPGLLLEGGRTCRDPRLQEIDLRGRLRRLALTVTDEDGAAVPGTVVREDRPTDGTGPAPFWTAAGRSLRLLTPRWPLDLRVEAPGRRTVRLPGVDHDLAVVLRPGLQVVLEISPPPRAGPGEELWVELLRPDAGPGAIPVRAGIAGDGRAEVRLPEPGAWRLELVRIERSGRARVRGSWSNRRPRIVVEDRPGIQVFPVGLD
ncbi:MAG: carboxypeptidase regulatory-like domain-containing protein, partial [Planctomycetota bacterium]